MELYFIQSKTPLDPTAQWSSHKTKYYKYAAVVKNTYNQIKLHYMLLCAATKC